MHITADDIMNMFYSGYPVAVNWALVDDITVAVHTSALLYDSFSICAVSDYHWMLDTIHSIDGLGPQERGHMALKECVKLWCENILGAGVIFESYHIGLHPDVRTLDGKYIIECGTTDPACVLIYLDDSWIDWIGNAAYPVYGSQNIMIHRFRRGSQYSSWRTKRSESLRSTFNKFHRK